MDSTLKKTIILPKPTTFNDIKPEIWYIKNSKKHYLLYYPIIVSTHLTSFGLSSIGFEYITRNSIYICDYAPTIKIVSRQYFNKTLETVLNANVL